MKHKDRWDLPKGHVDDGETDLEAAFRELLEETGIAESEVEYDPTFTFTTRYEVNAKRYSGQKNGSITKTLIIFLGYIAKEKEIELTEHPGCDWLEWNPPHAIQKKTIDPVLRALEDHLGSDKMAS